MCIYYMMLFSQLWTIVDPIFLPSSHEALPKEVIVVYFAGYAMSGCSSRVRLQLQRAQHPEDVDTGRTIGVDELMDSMLRLPTRRQNCFVLAVLDCGYLSKKIKKKQFWNVLDVSGVTKHCMLESKSLFVM